MSLDIGQQLDEPASPARFWLGVAAYAPMLAATIGGFFLIRAYGETLARPQAPAVAAAPQSPDKPAAPDQPAVSVVFHVLATLAAVVILGHLLGRAMAWVGQPPVIGEVLAGIVLGPSLLGAISPDAMHWLIPDATADPHGQVLAAVKAIAQLGIILYMFIVGLDLNAGKIQDKAHTAVAISHASIVVPFLCGAGLALWLFPALAPPGVAFTSFSLFLGAALAITAFPVLARILTDRKLERTEMGVMALTCAAADDVTAWCLLAFVVGVAQAQIGGALVVCAGAGLFIAAMYLMVRPLLTRAAAAVESEPLSPGVVLLALAAMLLAALATEAIGIHAVFGPFLLGAMTPHDSRLARELTPRLRDVTTLLLLPAFFAITGMKAEIGLLGGGWEWLVCGAIILVATAGKVGGTVAAARLCGQDWRNSLALGALMNTRGLMGLIVLNIGLERGVISPTLFTMMVVMALATTLATSPALWLLGIEAEPDRQSIQPTAGG